MTQPTSYTPATDFSDDELSNVGGRSTVRTAQLDAELAAVATTLGGVLTNLALNQRDDGEIRDGRVKLHTLSADVRALLATTSATPRGAWVTATAYEVGDLVLQNTNTYICALAHTAGTFATDLAAVKWLVVALGSAVEADSVQFTATATLAAANVQAAIEESDTENRALSAAASAAVVAALARLASTTDVADGDALLGVKLDATGAVARTQHDKNADVISVFDFMTAAQIADVRARTLLEDVSDAVIAALSWASKGLLTEGGNTLTITTRSLFFPDGAYLVTTNNWISLAIGFEWGGRIDTILRGAGRNSSVIVFRPSESGAACYDQSLITANLLNGFKVEKMGFIFDDSENGGNPIHFIKSLAAPGAASQNWRLNETRFKGVLGSILFVLEGSVNEDVISVYDTRVDDFASIVKSNVNVEAVLHHFYSLDMSGMTGNVFEYGAGSLKVYGCMCIMTGTAGTDTAFLKLGDATTTRHYSVDELRIELRGANTRLLLIPVAAENTITFSHTDVANVVNDQAWAKVVAQHHATIVFDKCIFPIRTGVGEAGTLQLTDSTSGIDYTAAGKAHSFIRFQDCDNEGDRSSDTDGWVDYSQLTAPNANYRTFQVSYQRCGNLPESVEYGHPYRQGASFVTDSPARLIFRGTTFPLGDGAAALVSAQDMNCVVPLNNFVTEIVVMRKAKSGATSYQIEFIDTLERTAPGTGVIFGETTAANNNVAIAQRVPILRAFTGTRAQRTIWARMKAGYTLSAAGSTGGADEGGIYAEIL